MIDVLKRPEHLTSLASAGILVSVEITAWTGSKQDRSISDEVAVAKRAHTDAGRYVKNLLSGDSNHKRLVNHRQTVYNFIKRHTYPWSPGADYLPSIRIPQFMEGYKALREEYDSLLEEFLNNYPTIVSNAAFSQGDMFDRNDYPTVDQLRGKFTMRLYTSEVPMSDFRCQIAQDLADDLFTTYSRQASDAITAMLGEQRKQLTGVMESLSHCCDVEVSTDGDGNHKVKRRKIYDTTINRALELCSTFEKFNLANDPELESARMALAKALDGVTLGALRESDSLREQVKTEVDDILSKFRYTNGSDE